MQKADSQVLILSPAAGWLIFPAIEDFGEDPDLVEGGNHQDVPVQPEQRHHRGVPQEDEADPAQGLWFQELRELQVEGQGVMRLIWHWILLSTIGIGPVPLSLV